MKISHLSIILYTTALALFALYAPQPLLPLLSKEFGVGMGQVSLLISVTLFPLGLAPIFYGFVLEAVPASRLLRISVLLLALSELPFLWVNDFRWLVALRAFQGLLLPAVLTGLTTYLSNVSRPELIRRKMSFYIAATIAGGFLGRLIAGLAATYLHWRDAFLIMGIGLFIAFLLLHLLHGDRELHFTRPKPENFKAILADARFRQVYLVIFLVFFCFASLLNLLPFRLTTLNQGVSELQIGFAYSGYLTGMIMALTAVRIAHRLGEINAMLTGMVIYLCAIALFAIPHFSFMFINMFLFCSGMFLVHTLLAAYLNHSAAKSKGLVNGLYISSYYTGGTLGSYLPGFVYQHYGWHAYILLSALLAVIGLIAILRLRKIESGGNSTTVGR